MSENDIYAEVLRNVIANDIAEYEKLPDHNFSRRFEHKMKKLLVYSGTAVYQPSVRRIPFRRTLMVAILAIILAAIITGATFAVYWLWEYYRVKDLGLYSMLYITNMENVPKTLEEQYRLGADMSGYSMKVVQDDEYCYLIEYTNSYKYITICFEQITKEMGEQIFLNTENANESPSEILINGYSGIYFETYYGAHFILWDIDDYFLDISATGISKNELILLAETVKKVEK